VKVFVDTSALYALLDREDDRHLEASATLQQLRTGADLVTHNYVHAECLALVRRRLGAAATLALIDDLIPLVETIWVSEATHRAALAAVRAGRGVPGLVDEVSFAVMRDLGIEVAFAYDQDFERKGFRQAPGPAGNGQPRLSESRAPYGGSEWEADLVGVAEIATRSGRPINTVQSWRRRRVDFPAPAARLATGPVWRWPVVRDWIQRRVARRPGLWRGKVKILPRFEA
jgi:predicted nucleic acid-binding protein